MNTAYKALLAGMLAIVFSGPALAHGGGPQGGSYYNGAYPAGISGGVSVWGNSQGQTGWTGSLSIGAGVVYAPVYAVPVGVVHVPGGHYPPGHGYKKAYRKGYKHGQRDARLHRQGHGRHH